MIYICWKLFILLILVSSAFSKWCDGCYYSTSQSSSLILILIFFHYNLFVIVYLNGSVEIIIAIVYCKWQDGKKLSEKERKKKWRKKAKVNSTTTKTAEKIQIAHLYIQINIKKRHNFPSTILTTIIGNKLERKNHINPKHIWYHRPIGKFK